MVHWKAEPTAPSVEHWDQKGRALRASRATGTEEKQGTRAGQGSMQTAIPAALQSPSSICQEEERTKPIRSHKTFVRRSFADDPKRLPASLEFYSSPFSMHTSNKQLVQKELTSFKGDL